MGKECKCHAYFTSKAARNKDWYCEQGIKQQRLIWHRGMDTEFEWQKIKADKKMTRLFSIEFNVLDFSTPCFFFSQLFTRLKRSSSFRGKMIQKWSEGKQKLLSSWREVRVIWSQLYSIQSEDYMSDADIFLELILLCW